MKRITTLLVPVFAFALAGTASAQGGGKPVVTGDGATDTMKVTVSGWLDMDWVLREGEVVNVRGGGTDDNNGIEGTVGVRLDAELSSNIAATVEGATRRLNGDTVTSIFGANAESTDIVVTEANVTFREALNPSLTIKAGIVPHSFQVSDQGGKIFDPRWSDSIQSYQNNDPTVGLGYDELQPSGVVGMWARENFSLDLFLLPSIDDGGDSSADEAAYGADVWWNLAGTGSLAEGSGLGVLFAWHALPGSENDFLTFGGGVNLVGLVQSLDLFVEAYANSGQVVTEA